MRRNAAYARCERARWRLLYYVEAFQTNLQCTQNTDVRGKCMHSRATDANAAVMFY
jgi:hypothetical protein